MDRITRKTLKTDRFATEVTQSVEYLSEHRRQASLYGGIAVAAVLIAAGIYFYFQHRNSAAHEALAKAFETYRAQVSDEEIIGRRSFRTDAEKNSQALKDFEAVTRDFSGRTEGKIARYYIGLVYYNKGNLGEAQKRLEQLAGEKEDSVSSLARFTLAEIYGAQGKDDLARKTYEYLIQHPTDTVPEGRAQLGLARFLSKRNPQEARKMLIALMQRPGIVAGAAGNMLREMGQAQ